MYECAEEFRWLYTHSGGLDEDGESEPRTGFERTVRRADGATYNRFRGEDGEEGDDERSAEAFRIPARSELGVGELMVVRLCYSGGAAFSLHLLYRDSALHRPDCLGCRVLLPVSKQRLHAWIGRGRKNSICAVFGKHRATPFDALDSLRWTILIAPFR